MAKEDIPIKQSAFGGTPVTDVLSAQRAIKESSILGAQNEPSQEDEEKTETTEEASAQDMKLKKKKILKKKLRNRSDILSKRQEKSIL